MKIFYLLSFFAISISIQAQDFVYKPKNPNFGGDTFNYQWLLSSADSQNKFKEPTTANAFAQKTQIEKFKDNLNNQLLNQLSKSLFENKFGTGAGSTVGGLAAGSYVFGSLSVDVTNSSDGLVVTILDINTGEQTQIIIP